MELWRLYWDSTLLASSKFQNSGSSEAGSVVAIEKCWRPAVTLWSRVRRSLRKRSACKRKR
ncbi:unnamed protein product [Linum tenue]|uniref:Uncharacterized protein n=1 Tax=Linum tenue TaxID=586396 RepID=A0AAV0IXF7_9ROSI|nr:unnamed protein product [Linum tenue]